MDKFVIANLKMNIISPVERERYLESLKKELAEKKFKNTQIVLCPPAIHLESFSKFKNKRISFGTQNIFWEKSGPFTGEISATMVKNFGADFVILGHSERRRYFGEKDADVNLKINAALKVGLTPVVCIGESRAERSIGADIIKKQLENCLAGINRAKVEKIILCYEPVWAISSNNPDHLPSTNDIMSARLIIKKFLVENYGAKMAEKIKIIYGGSVSAEITKEVCLDAGMDGALVGKDSLSPYKFVKIAEIINK